jgi:uncharacterized repeat protein (TIGR03806 family)
VIRRGARRAATIAIGLGLGLGLAPAGCGDNAPVCDASHPFCAHLSDYGLFDDLASQAPADGVLPYEVNTPLFSDYATKERFLRLPPGEPATWNGTDALGLPVGTILVKTFGYLHDRRDPASGQRLLETRLLLHGADGWRGAAYVYRDDASEADLAEAGAVIDASWIHDDGTMRTNAYVVPNENQCKNCHGEHEKNVPTPLGPKARHLDRPGPGGENQLQHLIDLGLLVGAPPPDAWPRAPIASDPSTGNLDQRARAWLDINCGHCHNPRGAARTSGLYLDIFETDPSTFGVCKPPVATGRGSGGRPYDLVPGQPDQSILMYRISSTAPEIKMPELGRNLVDEEDVAMIRDWIEQMPGGCASVAGDAGGRAGRASERIRP